jgi:hypothetical protein
MRKRFDSVVTLDDFPDPQTPVKTTRESRGISTSTFLRLCSRAPRTCTIPLGSLAAALREYRLSLCAMSRFHAWEPGKSGESADYCCIPVKYVQNVRCFTEASCPISKLRPPGSSGQEIQELKELSWLS